MPYNVNAVVTETFTFNDFIFTMNVSGAVTMADLRKAVTLDKTAPNTVKLAGDGDEVYGRIETFETGGLDGLTVGAISRKFRTTLPKTAPAIAVGDVVIGAGGGLVKKNAAAGAFGNTVIEVRDNSVVVEKL